MTKKFLVDIKCTGLTKEQAPGFENFILDLLNLLTNLAREILPLRIQN